MSRGKPWLWRIATAVVPALIATGIALASPVAASASTVNVNYTLEQQGPTTVGLNQPAQVSFAITGPNCSASPTSPVYISVEPENLPSFMGAWQDMYFTACNVWQTPVIELDQTGPWNFDLKAESGPTLGPTDGPILEVLTLTTPAPADTTPPVLSLPSNQTVEATGPHGALVNFTATANDNVDGSVPVTCSPSSGTTLPLGITTVNCSASDSSGNTANGSFTMNVRDTTAPALPSLPDLNLTATSAAGAVATYGPATATDAVDGTDPVTFTPAPGGTFAPGSHTVTYSATDAAGNIAAAKLFNVNVTYAWNGFFAPVDNTLVNVSKAGQSIPIKFSLGGDMGLNVLNGTPAVVSGNTTGDTTGTDTIDAYTTSVPGLTYDASSEQYTYVWKTSKAWAGTTQTLVVTLSDGSVHKAAFSFK